GLAQREPHGQLVDGLDRRQVAGVALRAALVALVDGDRLEVGLLGPVARLVVVAPARRGHEAERDEEGEPAGALPSHGSPLDAVVVAVPAPSPRRRGQIVARSPARCARSAGGAGAPAEIRVRSRPGASRSDRPPGARRLRTAAARAPAPARRTRPCRCPPPPARACASSGCGTGTRRAGWPGSARRR